MTMDEAIFVKKDIVVNSDNLHIRIEPRRITDDIVKDPEFVKLIVRFIKEKYGYVNVDATDIVDINEPKDLYKVDIYLELYKAYPKGPEVRDELKELLDEI